MAKFVNHASAHSIYLINGFLSVTSALMHSTWTLKPIRAGVGWVRLARLTLLSDTGSSLAGQILTRGESLARETACKHSGREHKTMPQLKVFREDIPRAISVSPMHACQHRLNVCGMQCTSYYIGYLLSTKASWVILLSN